MSRVLIVTNMVNHHTDELLTTIAAEMHQLIDYEAYPDIKFIVDKKRRRIEYGDFQVAFGSSTHKKLAGLQYDYFLTDNDEALSYSISTYRGSQTVSELHDVADILKIFIEYLEELKNECFKNNQCSFTRKIYF